MQLGDQPLPSLIAAVAMVQTDCCNLSTGLETGLGKDCVYSRVKSSNTTDALCPRPTLRTHVRPIFLHQKSIALGPNALHLKSLPRRSRQALHPACPPKLQLQLWAHHGPPEEGPATPSLCCSGEINRAGRHVLLALSIPFFSLLVLLPAYPLLCCGIYLQDAFS